ncbi:hypothetical protein SPHINGOR109_11106 [Sphingorhabdus sp. 109]|nr:hypothetical protein SPHINGOR109_11106 [Sphingorhabdus sp. 109]
MKLIRAIDGSKKTEARASWGFPDHLADLARQPPGHRRETSLSVGSIAQQDLMLLACFCATDPILINFIPAWQKRPVSRIFANPNPPVLL